MVGGWKTRSRSVRCCSSLCKALALVEDGLGGEVPEEVAGDALDLAEWTNGLEEAVQVGEIWSLLAIVVNGKASDGRKNQDATDAHCKKYK